MYMYVHDLHMDQDLLSNAASVESVGSSWHVHLPCIRGRPYMCSLAAINTDWYEWRDLHVYMVL